MALKRWVDSRSGRHPVSQAVPLSPFVIASGRVPVLEAIPTIRPIRQIRIPLTGGSPSERVAARRGPYPRDPTPIETTVD
jgi:hypothetical protein